MEWLLFLSLVFVLNVVHQHVLSATRGIYLCILKLELYLEVHQHIMIVKEAQTRVAGVTFFHIIIIFQFICPVCLCAVIFSI
jgi:hypothetical protein